MSGAATMSDEAGLEMVTKFIQQTSWWLPMKSVVIRQIMRLGQKVVRKEKSGSKS